MLQINGRRDFDYIFQNIFYFPGKKRPPSPTTLRKSSTTLPPSAAMKKAERSPKPSLPNLRVELESPKLADYLEKPRLVNAIQSKSASTVEVARGHHAKRYENGGASIPEYRNLRLGNFMENQAQNDEPNNEEEVIPDVLRQYYLDTYLNPKYDYCDPTSPIHRGM